jgi:DNA-binding transcriptional ArsR family regulator
MSEARTGAGLMLREAVMPTIGARQMRVELDKKSLFALASDTRLDILRSLQPMRRTVTQLAESLNIDKAAVHRHLKKLEEGGLVKRYEEHGFVYYGLSWKARDLMSPNENTKVIVLLSASWVLSVLVAFLLIASVLATSIGGQNSYGGPSTGGNNQQMTGEDNQNKTASTSVQWFVYAAPGAALASLAVALVAISYRSVKRPKQPSAQPEGPFDDVPSRDTD